MADLSFIKPSKTIKDLLIIERPTFPDDRGFFREAFRLNELEEFLGHPFKPVQWNHSKSLPNVIRGLHAENWNKFGYPVCGEMVSFFVDIRPNSPTFAKVDSVKFSDETPKGVYIPKGIANSICVTGTKPVNYLYLVDAYYDGKDTTAVAWDDPDINIKWPVENPIVSEKDRNNPKLRDLFPNKFK